MKYSELVRVANAFLVLLLGVSGFACASGQTPSIELALGVDGHGFATEEWRFITQELKSNEPLNDTDVSAPYTAHEQAWLRTIESRLQSWEQEASKMAPIIAPLPPPSLRIVAGNRWGEDAFTHGLATIGFDLRRLQDLYGDAIQKENRDRLDRFFRHEYVHLLQKSWWLRHPIQSTTPLDQALAGILAEGMGNYFSLSGRWRAADGSRGEAAKRALLILEPRFVARLAALSCATPGSTTALTADLSKGSFDAKWGALPVALWIESERDHEKVLRELLANGPEGIWDFAAKHIDPALRPVLAEARANAVACKTLAPS